MDTLVEMKPRFFASPTDFRKWLKSNHSKADELWVGYYKKGTGRPSLSWSESVDEALCYGWIDGIRKSIDEKRYKIRFTPRKPCSSWSAINIKKVKALTKAGLMHTSGLAAYKKRSAKKSERYSYEQSKVELDEKYERKLKANRKAWAFFQTLPPSAKKPSIWWVISAKKEETRLRRLGMLIKSSAAGEKVPLLVLEKKPKKSQ